MPDYLLRYEAAYLNDLRFLRRAYDLPIITRAVLLLATQAETPTRNRRPLTSPISWCPTATWQQRVEGYRVLYRVEGGEVQVLRVLFKGSKATEEMCP